MIIIEKNNISPDGPHEMPFQKNSLVGKSSMPFSFVCLSKSDCFLFPLSQQIHGATGGKERQLFRRGSSNRKIQFRRRPLVEKARIRMDDRNPDCNRRRNCRRCRNHDLLRGRWSFSPGAEIGGPQLFDDFAKSCRNDGYEKASRCKARKN